VAEATDKIPGVLACDVGNSAIHLAGVHGESVSARHVLPAADQAATAKALAELWEQLAEPKKVIVASVNPAALETLEAAASQAGLKDDLLVIGRDLPLPIETAVKDAEAVGVDRLCCAVAAFDRLGQACVVADFGTAITIDCVNDEGVFLGGAILPGLAMSARALHTWTAQLPEVQLRRPEWVFGADTAEAIVGGLVYGARGALRRLVEVYAEDLGHWPLVIATGGDAELIIGNLEASDLIQAIVPDLALRGVAAAYYRTFLG